ncbi:dUTP diphosphatase [Peribacillus kribbensis]|uniref:dUTP diphosphatase n=1 Tax=Peribacillus kribbensis TaxID=356658 RepID=UPI000429E134|nr:dUTP diphosphatase [Peribacillus kribbensis]
MDYKKLYDMQTGLDSHIESQHGLDKKDLFEEKVLALLVELGELANETRCFKFWSVKEASPRETILAEYVDGIHFILSLGITESYTEETPQVPGNKKDGLTVQFLVCNESILHFRKTRTKDSFLDMFSEYLQLGRLLGFSTSDIEEAYVKKNEINYLRQKQGY